MNSPALTLFALLALTPGLLAQGPNEGYVLESEATSHVLPHPDPVYPPIAKAAHVQGSVLLHVTVNEKGEVTHIQAIGGPAMLKGAAIEAVKSWHYRPFLTDGRAAPATLVVSVPFSLGIPAAAEKSDQAIGEAYFPMDDQCRADNAAGHWSDAVAVCGAAVSIADRFPDRKSRSNELRSAHEHFGQALAFSGDLPAALQQFRITVDFANRSLTSTDAEYGSAYYWLAFAEHASHMPAEAERDYRIAEDSYRKAIVSLPSMDKIYKRYLAHTLAYHSVLEQQTDHPEKAEKMRAEATTLDPHALDGMGK